jgi:hypothetical protein
MRHRAAWTVVVLLLASLVAADLAVAAPGRVGRLFGRGTRPTEQHRPTDHRPDEARRANSNLGKKRMGIGDALRAAREELQLYRGKLVERWSDKLAHGKSDFRPGQSVERNLGALAREIDLPTYTKKIDGRDVLHIVVDLADGKKSQSAIRRLFKRVGENTVEVNFKAPGGRNTYGHVAVRVGAGATYDLTGSNGVHELPRVVETPLRMITGRNGIVAPRKRSLRRFFESRKLTDSAPVFYGMLFEASPREIAELEQVYEQRLGQVKDFKISGGDASKGEFSCAQFLTHETPFLARRGIRTTPAAKGMAADAARSDKLSAVVVYKMPTTKIAELPPLGDFQDND